MLFNNVSSVTIDGKQVSRITTRGGGLMYKHDSNPILAIIQGPPACRRCPGSSTITLSNNEGTFTFDLTDELQSPVPSLTYNIVSLPYGEYNVSADVEIVVLGSSDNSFNFNENNTQLIFNQI